MKYTVRYEMEDFVVKEQFKTENEAIDYYDRVMEKLGDYIIDIQLYENE